MSNEFSDDEYSCPDHEPTISMIYNMISNCYKSHYIKKMESVYVSETSYSNNPKISPSLKDNFFYSVDVFIFFHMFLIELYIFLNIYLYNFLPFLLYSTFYLYIEKHLLILSPFWT